jgi:putative flavoprotein involved in K+ transport
VSGKGGGHNINLHTFARDGVTLLGHVQGVQDGRLFLAPDLKESLAKADAFEAEVVKVFDGFVTRSGMDAPEEQLPILRDGFEAEVIAELNLASAGVTTVIWAMGYSFDYSLVKVPLVDSMGFPIQTRGVTNYAGLYVIGSLWQTKQKSSLVIGVGDDAAFIASHIAARTME